MKDSGSAQQAYESEQAVLGIILRQPAMTSTIIERLPSRTYFQSPRNAVIYDAVREVVAGGKEPDLATVVDTLRATGQLYRAGGACYVSDLADQGIPSLVNQYCNRIIDARCRYRLGRELTAAQKRLGEGASLINTLSNLSSAMDSVARESAYGQGYKTLSTKEVLEASENIKWVIEGLLPANGVGILSGDSGSGKTWLGLSLAIAVATGRDWLSIFGTTQGSVLMIDEENGADGVAQRLRLLGADRDEATVPVFFACFEGVRLDTPRGESRLVATIRECSAKLIIIDSLIRVHDSDENKASDMKTVMGTLIRIARQGSCAILLTHHTRKRSYHFSHAGQNMRGSSELKAAIDLHMCITKYGGSRLTIEVDKVRFGELIQPVEVLMTKEENGIYRFHVAGERRNKFEKARKIILDCLTGASDPVLREDLEGATKAADVSPRTFAKALKALQDEGVLVEVHVVERTEGGRPRTLKAFSLGRQVSQ